MIYYDNTFEIKVRDLLYDRFPKIKKAYIKTYGCQQNVSDSEKIRTLALNMGYHLTDSPADADLVVFNTCAVRHSAEDKIIGNVGILVDYKRQNPDMIVVLCGCMTQQSHMSEMIFKKYPIVDIIIGTSGIHKLPELIYNRLNGGKRKHLIYNESDDIVEGLIQTRNEKFRAFVPIMYGCNNFCSYCIVPYVRGRERSRKTIDVINDVKALVADGCKDVTLLGQNVNSYNSPDNNKNFPELLRLINEIDGDFKLRFMTSHPKDASRELIDTIRECDKLAKHIHLPVQSGSNRILKIMNRRYSREEYLTLVEYAKNKINNLSLTSDIIVGFPGETEEDFQDTLSLVDEVKYDSLFTFLYSRREGTPAARMDNQIPAEIKQDRFNRLLDLQNKNGLIINQSMNGKEYDVLVDEIKKKYDNSSCLLSSRTDSNKIVEFEGPENLYGNIARVRITEPKSWLLKGELINTIR